jgi:hypothetical protein
VATTYVAFDTRSGRILSVYHGAMDARQAHERALYHAKTIDEPNRAQINEEHIAVIAVPSDVAERGKQYKVDVGRKVLVATAAGEDGVGFSYGSTGRSS